MPAARVDDMNVARSKEDTKWLHKVFSGAFLVNILSPSEWYTICAFEHDMIGSAIL